MSTSSRNLYFAASVACMVAALFGYSVGFIGGVLVLPSFLHHFQLDDLPPSDLAKAQAGTVTSWLVGTLVGVIAGMPIYTQLGRKPCLLFCAVLYTIGAAMQVGNVGSIAVFDVGRLINGVGLGAGTLVTPLYISEISTPDTRGVLMSGFQVVVQFSALIGFWGAYFANEVYPDSSEMQYQIPVALQLVPAVLLVIGILFIPEAPRFLLEKDRIAVLTTSIAWLRGLQEDDMEVAHEVQQMRAFLEAGHRAQVLRQKGFVDQVLTRQSLRKRLTVGIGLMVAQNMSGLNAINYFAPSIFRSAGFTSVQSMLFLTGLFGLIKVIAALAFMMCFVRVKGNRFWLHLGSGACAVSMFVLAGCIYAMPSHQQEGKLSTEGIVSVFCVYIFSFFFGVGLGPISWNVCGEIFPPTLSAKCCTITTFTQWLFQIVIANLTPRLIASVGGGTYIFYGSFCVVSLIWCWVCVPETRGVPMGKGMDALFEGDEKETEAAEEIEEMEEAMLEVNETSALLGTSQRRHRRSSVALIV